MLFKYASYIVTIICFFNSDIDNLLSKEVETTERLDSNLLGHLKTRQAGVGKERGPVEGASTEGENGEIPSRLQVSLLEFHEGSLHQRDGLKLFEA